MSEWIITSSVLILIIVALRYFFKGKISLRLQYGLWVLVLIRLLIPFSMGNSSISILNFTVRPGNNGQPDNVPGITQQTEALPDVSVTDTEAYTDKISSDIPAQNNETLGKNQDLAFNEEIISVPDSENSVSWTITDIDSVNDPGEVTGEPEYSRKLSVAEVLKKTIICVWIAGVILMGGCLAFVNIRFTYGLKKSRRYLSEIEGYPLPVYFAENIDTPCMHGLVRPRIYVTKEAMADEKVLHHVLEHETTHYRHGDHVWGVLRNVCLALHWYNPFVWLAAILSRNDAELACDEGTINRIGEVEREEYGRTLIGLTCQKKNGLFVTATTMTGSRKSIKERITLIAKQPKMAIYTLMAVLVIATAAIGCTFTGASGKEDTTAESGDNKDDTSVNETTTGEEEPDSTTGKEEVTPAFTGTIAVGSGYIAGLNTNGKVSLLKKSTANGPDEEVIGKWENLTSIVAGSDMVGLKADGTVYSLKNNLQSWSDIVMIDASDSDIIGLKKDGTVLAKGDTYINKTEWQNIIQVSAGYKFAVGLKADKTVVTAGDNTFGQLEVSGWTDVCMVSAGYNHVVGLRSNGTVLAAGAHFLGQCDVADWKDIVFVAAGEDFTVGVKSDGTVLATGYNIEKRCAGIEDWTNVAYVFTGRNCVLGMTNDGKILGAGYLDAMDVAGLKDIVMPAADISIDFSKKLTAVEQKYIELEVKAVDYDGEVTYLEPENGILKADNFSVKISEEIADRICYLCREDAIDIYFKEDFSYQYDSADNCITYLPARAGSVMINRNIASSVVALTPEWVLGDAQERNEVNEYIHAVLKQICELASKEYAYQDYVYVAEDGKVRGSDLYELYFEYADRISVAERVYYTFGSPTDVQLTHEENGEELEAIRKYLSTSAEIIAN